MAKTSDKSSVQNTKRTAKSSDSKVKLARQSQNTVLRGKPKSGRFWKNEKKKFSSIVKTRGIKSSFEKKQALREELKRVKEASRAVLAAKEEEKELKKQRRRENLKRQEENRKKSEVVQVITNTKKIKKMKKKQLRLANLSHDSAVIFQAAVFRISHFGILWKFFDLPLEKKMLGRSSLFARNVISNFVRNGSHGGVPGENLPFSINNRYKLTAMFIVFFGSGFGAPFLILRHQLLKK